MRTLFLALVLANLGLFAWATYFRTGEPGNEASPLERQIAPEELRILPPPPVRPAQSKPGADGPVVAACLEWGGFSPTDAAIAEAALEKLALGGRLTQRRSEDVAGWWVFMPPQGNRATAQKKTAELKALGVQEFFVLQDEGPMRFAISLGVFKNEDAAKVRLETVRGRGVRSAQMGPRDTPVQKIWFQVRAVEESLAVRLKDIVQAVPGAELKECPAAAAPTGNSPAGLQPIG